MNLRSLMSNEPIRFSSFEECMEPYEEGEWIRSEEYDKLKELVEDRNARIAERDDRIEALRKLALRILDRYEGERQVVLDERATCREEYDESDEEMAALRKEIDDA